MQASARFKGSPKAATAVMFACGLALSVGVSACADDDDGSKDGDGNGGGDGNGDGGDGNGGGGEDGSAQPPGPSADGWMSDYVDGGVGGLSCEDDGAAFESSGAPRVTIGGATIYVGFEQIGDNQNPIVARVDDGQKVWCQIHETEGPDGRALGITWDGGDTAYVVYTIVGGGSSLEGKGGWLPSYAPGAISGGGPKVSYIGKVAADDGTLESGTFIIAVKSDNKVNSHGPSGPVTVLEDGNVEFLGGSAHKPIDADGKTSMNCTDYPFDSKYVLSPNLDSLVCAQCTNCEAQMPCD